MAQEKKLKKKDPDPEMLKHLPLLKEMDLLQMIRELKMLRKHGPAKKPEGK